MGIRMNRAAKSKHTACQIVGNVSVQLSEPSLHSRQSHTTLKTRKSTNPELLHHSKRLPRLLSFALGVGLGCWDSLLEPPHALCLVRGHRLLHLGQQLRFGDVTGEEFKLLACTVGLRILCNPSWYGLTVLNDSAGFRDRVSCKEPVLRRDATAGGKRGAEVSRSAPSTAWRVSIACCPSCCSSTLTRASLVTACTCSFSAAIAHRQHRRR